MKKSYKKTTLYNLLAVRKTRIALCEKSLFLFFIFYFRKFIKHKSADFHKDLAKLLMFPSFMYLLIIGFRESAKTTWAKIKIIHSICYRKKKLIIYSCFDKKKAEKNLFDVAIQLQTNKYIIQDFGQLFYDEAMNAGGEKKSKKKSISDFLTTNNVRVIATSTNITARGEGGLESRPDLIVVDDFENIKTYKSKIKTQAVIEYIDEIMTGASVDCNIIFLANRISKTGSVAYIESKCESNNNFKLYEIKLYTNKIISWASKYVWTKAEAEKINANREPDRKVKSIEQMIDDYGTRVFNREFLNNPSDEATQKIKESWITGSYHTISDYQGMKMTMAVDPSSGESETADEFSISITGAYKYDTHRYAIENHGWRKLSLTQKAGYIIAYWLKYKQYIDKIGIEVVLNQTSLYQLLVEWANGRNVIPEYEGIEDRNIPIMKISPMGRDKENRVELQEPKFERGEIHIRPNMEKLKDQMTEFPNALNDDRLDSFIYTLEMMQHYPTSKGKETAKREQTKTIGVKRNKTF